MMKIFNWEIKSKLQEAHEILKEKLREFEAKYMEIVESSSDIIHSVDKDNMIVRSNKPGCELLGYSQEELIGHTIRELFVSDTWEEFKGMFSKIKQEGSAFIDYGQLKKKNGEKLDVAIHAIAMYDNKKKFVGTRLTCRDITEQKLAEEAVRESEERYRLLFQESRDAIYISSRDGKFFDINDSGLDLFGYTKEEIAELNPNQIFADPEDRIKYQKSIEDQEFVRDFQIKLRKKSGEIMECLITSTVRKSSEGNIIGYQGMIRDITEQKKMEEELQKIEKLESLGIMAGGIAHDFNNLLTTITSNISLISMTDDNKLLELLKDSKIACNHAKNLTHQLLTFSRGGAPIKKVSYIGNLLKDSSSFALRGSNIRCTYTIPLDLWPVEIDEGQISQVMHNLVLNAMQAMAEGGTIDIRAENIKEGTRDMVSLDHKKYVKFSIEDRGIGIPKEHIKKIFDPYFTTKEDGSGLGLASTYSIIKNHGGDIDVSSELDSGTAFHVYLQASEKKLPVKKEKTANSVRGTGKILLMDDEQSVRKTVQRMLNYLGYEVEISSNGEDAIDLYKKAIKSRHPFDVIIMDLTIRGGMGGKETINKLLEIDSGVKAIVSSGYFNNPIMADYKKHGFCGVIPKPYEMEELNSLLQSIIIDSN
jgi:PAS domain S-box-containing protein